MTSQQATCGHDRPGNCSTLAKCGAQPRKLRLRHLAAHANPRSRPSALPSVLERSKVAFESRHPGNLGFEEFEIERDSLNAEATGSATLTGGTGKYEGISGDLTHTRMLLLPGPKEGVFPGIGTITGSVRF